MLEVVLNDRLGKKVRVKCNEDDTIGDLKKLGPFYTHIIYISFDLTGKCHTHFFWFLFGSFSLFSLKKKIAAAQLGTRPEKLRIQKWYTIYKDHITLEDYEIHDGMGLEL